MHYRGDEEFTPLDIPRDGLVLGPPGIASPKVGKEKDNQEEVRWQEEIRREEKEIVLCNSKRSTNTSFGVFWLARCFPMQQQDWCDHEQY